MEQLFSQYGRIITSRILVDQVTGQAAGDDALGKGMEVGPKWRNREWRGRSGLEGHTGGGRGAHDALTPWQVSLGVWGSSASTRGLRPRRPSKD